MVLATSPRGSSAGLSRQLVIAGAGGHGRVVAEAAELAGWWKKICFVDDRYPALSSATSWPVVGRVADLNGVLSSEPSEAVVAIGNGATRLHILNSLVQAGHVVATVIHPAAICSPRSDIGFGSVVLAGACINIGARLGRGVIVNTAATVDHDCDLGDGVHLCPGAHLAGDVKVGRLSWIGTGAAVRQGIAIAEDVTVGAGAAVVRDLEPGVVAVGVPAKVLRRSATLADSGSSSPGS